MTVSGEWIVDSTAALPTFEFVLDEMIAAEGREGWLCASEDAGRFLSPCRELVESLVETLDALGDGPVLEVAAGSGELVAALQSAGATMIATDIDPPTGSGVSREPARDALRRHRPTVVLGSFVPVDSDLDRLVMSFPTVRHYLVLGARIGGFLGSDELWHNSAWTSTPLETVTPWMLTRHDVWIDNRRTLRHGEAWHFSRR